MGVAKKMIKCKRCSFRLYGEYMKQWCPDLDCYVDICRNCGIPERMARGHKVVGAIFD
jgi:hypothetical protein